MANLVITGSRAITDPMVFRAAIQFYFLEGIVQNIYVGDAEGVDRLAAEYAIKNNIPLKVFEAHWDKLGKAAGPIRNARMLNIAIAEFTRFGVRVLGIPHGQSVGTYHCMVAARNMGLQVLPYTQEFHSKYVDRYMRDFKKGKVNG